MINAFLAALAFIASPAHPQTTNTKLPPDMFRDVPKSSWLYKAELKLWRDGVIHDRPFRTGYFGSHGTLTRYEYAASVDRILRNLQEWNRRRPRMWEDMPFVHQGILLNIIRELAPELAAMGNYVSGTSRKRTPPGLHLDLMVLDIWETAETLQVQSTNTGVFEVTAPRR